MVKIPSRTSKTIADISDRLCLGKVYALSRYTGKNVEPKCDHVSMPLENLSASCLEASLLKIDRSTSAKIWENNVNFISSGLGLSTSKLKDSFPLLLFPYFGQV
jgi:hypothetical protein